MLKGLSYPRAWVDSVLETPKFLSLGACIFFFKGCHNKATGGFPGGSSGKESACNARDLGLIPGLGRSPGEGNDNPLQYSYLENSMARGTWQAIVHVVARVGCALRTKQQQ